MSYEDSDIFDPRKFLKPRPAVLQQSDDRLDGVVLADIDIGFWRLVWLMLKFMLASVPAVIAFMVIMFFVVNIISIGGLVALMAAFGGR